jgi:hypothetical protein
MYVFHMAQEPAAEDLPARDSAANDEGLGRGFTVEPGKLRDGLTALMSRDILGTDGRFTTNDQKPRQMCSKISATRLRKRTRKLLPGFHQYHLRPTAKPLNCGSESCSDSLKEEVDYAGSPSATTLNPVSEKASRCRMK